MRLSLVFLCCLLSAQLLLAGQSQARALFMIRDFRNWLELEYDYDGSSFDNPGNNESLSEQQLLETYHFEMAYAVYSPRWLNGHLEIDLGLLQEWYDGTTDGSGFDNSFVPGYRLDGIIMDRSSFPTSFFAASEITRADRRYARNYDLQNDNYGVSTTYKNRHIPVNLSYFYNRSETDGLELDREIETETFSADCSHQTDNGFSLSELNYFYTDDKTSFFGSEPSEESNIEEFFARNSLTWGEHLKRCYFISSYRYREEEGLNPIKSTDWFETLDLRPGFALRVGLEYQFSKDDTDTLNRKDNRYRGWIEHHLYDSLVTAIRASSRNLEVDSGTEDENGYVLSLSYRKELPAESYFTMGYSYGYEETERDFDDNRFFVINEAMIVDLFERNLLNNLDVVAETIVVYNEDRFITFVEGADYTVEQIGRETEIIIPSGSLISEGDKLSLDYEYLVDPDIDFSTAVHQANTTLTLFDRHYRIYANFVNSKQKPLSSSNDPDRYNSLYDLETWTVGVEGEWHYVTCGLEYTDYDSTTDIRQYVEGFIDFRRYFRRDFIFLYLRDRMTNHDDLDNGTDGNAGTENVLTTGIQYRHKFPLGAFGEVNLDYLNQSGRNNDRQELDLEINYQLTVGKLEFEASLEEEWIWTDNQNERNDTFMLRIRRYF